MLKLHSVTVVYPDKTKAIDGIDLAVNKGESIALIGENGAGKTTLLLAIAGVLELSNGTVEIEGIGLNKKTVNEIRKRLGLVFQNPEDQLFMPFVFDDIAFGCRNFGMPEDKVTARVDETLAQLNISHLRDRSSLRLSGGENRMAALATVLAMEPSVLMLDEPAAFLDPKARRSLIGTLEKLPQTKVIATHDMAFAAELCSRIIVLKEGRIAADGTLTILYDKELMENCGLESIPAIYRSNKHPEL
jgi:cobalt/nickel transport system ATP-binding protein